MLEGILLGVIPTLRKEARARPFHGVGTESVVPRSRPLRAPAEGLLSLPPRSPLGSPCG